jgi:photosystem I P700 chlorophyll a apoprotein A2
MANYSTLSNGQHSLSHGHHDPHYSSLQGGLQSATSQYSGANSLGITIGLRDSLDSLSVSTAGLVLVSFLALVSLLSASLTSKSLSSLSHLTLTSSIWSLPFRSIYCTSNTHSFPSTLSKLGVASILWSGHLLHKSLLEQSGLPPTLSSLTCTLGIDPTTSSLCLGDIAHHHLSLGVLLVWLAHVLSRGASSISDISSYLKVSSRSGLSRATILNSDTLSKGLGAIFLALGSSLVSQHVSTMCPIFNLSKDYVSSSTIYVHHIWISNFLMLLGVYYITEYLSSACRNLSLLSSLLIHKSALISHLSWVSLFLGFHTFTLYVHNDTLMSFGVSSKQLAIDPTWALLIQSSSGKNSVGIFHPNSSWISQSLSSSLQTIGPSDLLSHHAIALGLHTTLLIVSKGCLDTLGTRLLPDKYNFQLSFSCDGPGRGGTCDISSWDSIYLSLFWLLNLGGWTTFYYHWKHLSLWQNTPTLFDEGATYLNGYFKDYLWFNSGPLIKGYDSLSTTDLSVYSWTFLLAHLIWAVGYMYLISWRGYWQELLDAILFTHLQSPYLRSLHFTQALTPSALSIVQARLVGVSHFSIGYVLTYPPFIIGSTI